MNKLKAILMGLSIFSLVACSDGNSTSSQSAVPENPAVAEENPGAGTEGAMSLQPSGEVVMISEVTDITVIGQSDVLADFPELASHVSTLDSITRVHYTDADTYDFWSGDDLVFTLARNEEGNLYVRDSMSGEFMADRIALTSSDMEGQNQALISDLFTFDLSSCRMIEVAQEQEPKEIAQEQEPKEEAQEQEQAQEKEEPKEEAQEKEECMALSVSVLTTEVQEEKAQEQEPKEEAQEQEPKEEAQEQEPKEEAQEKEEPKEVAQEKEEPKEEAQEKEEPKEEAQEKEEPKEEAQEKEEPKEEAQEKTPETQAQA